MPSNGKAGFGRTFVKYRVKAGNTTVHSEEREGDAKQWIRDHQKEYGQKLKLIPPNKSSPKR